MNEQQNDYLSMDDLAEDPFEQFGHWYAAAAEAGEQAPEVCCLSTATLDGAPSGRIVLLKAFDRWGFVVFTNYGSRKAMELEANPRAALTFHWPLAGRQARIEGSVARTSKAESEEYFASRPYDSRIGAWASSQSSTLESRKQLMDKFEQYGERYPDDKKIPLPEFWGGYRIAPTAVEFWQHGPHRLHDRFRYTLAGGVWQITRLFP